MPTQIAMNAITTLGMLNTGSRRGGSRSASVSLLGWPSGTGSVMREDSGWTLPRLVEDGRNHKEKPFEIRPNGPNHQRKTVQSFP